MWDPDDKLVGIRVEEIPESSGPFCATLRSRPFLRIDKARLNFEIYFGGRRLDGAVSQADQAFGGLFYRSVGGISAVSLVLSDLLTGPDEFARVRSADAVWMDVQQ